MCCKKWICDADAPGNSVGGAQWACHGVTAVVVVSDSSYGSDFSESVHMVDLVD